MSFDEGELESAGANLFRAKEGIQPKVDPATTVVQGKIEASNTNVMKNLIKLMEASREYQTYQKVLAAQNKIDETSASSIGKI